MLLELARNPKVQSRLRDEIRKTEATVYARGDSQLKAQDLDSMPYLNAVIKVLASPWHTPSRFTSSIHRKDYGSTRQYLNRFEWPFKMKSFRFLSQFSPNPEI
jgi:O-glycosyl hydrolase